MSAFTTPLPWHDPLFPRIVTGLAGATCLLYAAGWLSAVLSVPGCCILLVCSIVLYPTYLLYMIKPYTEPSVKRTIAIVAPAVLFAILARPLRVAEEWGLQTTHLILVTVALSIKKGLEFAVNRIEPSAVTQWHRFIIHYSLPVDIAFQDEPEQKFQQLLKEHALSYTSDSVHQSTPLLTVSSPYRPWHGFRLPSDEMDKLTADQYQSRFLHVRRRGFKSLLAGFWWFAVAIIPTVGCLLMYHYNHALFEARLFNHTIVQDALGGFLIAMCCCGMFSFAEAALSILYGDGLYISPMFISVFSSVSLSDFWSRWNRGIRDVLYYVVYKQLGGRHRLLLASSAVGICSGLIHEYQVFLYVGPHTRFNMMKFFMAHALGVALERLWSKYSPVRVNARLAKLLLYAWCIFTAGYFFADSGLSAKVLSELVVSFWCSLLCIPMGDALSLFQLSDLTNELVTAL